MVGHLHHNIYTEIGADQCYVMNGSVVGSDTFARNQLLLSGVACQTLLTIHRNRVKKTEYIYLGD